MAIANKWKETIANAGVSQNTVADAIEINRGWFSKVTNGSAILSDEERQRADEILSREFGFTVAAVYNDSDDNKCCQPRQYKRQDNLVLIYLPLEILHHAGDKAADGAELQQ